MYPLDTKFFQHKAKKNHIRGKHQIANPAFAGLSFVLWTVMLNCRWWNWFGQWQNGIILNM